MSKQTGPCTKTEVNGPCGRCRTAGEGSQRISEISAPARVSTVFTASHKTTAIAFVLPGFFSLQPNEARVLVLFGGYKGTVRESGFHWANPFYSNGQQSFVATLAESHKKKSDSDGAAITVLGRNKISLRARTLNGDTLKVNDKRGNPIEIAAVVVWRVGDTAQAVFDVENYENYVTTQSESALRHLASLYSYDGGGDDDTRFEAMSKRSLTRCAMNCSSGWQRPASWWTKRG